MNVNGINMVHVMLYLAVDLLELRNETVKQLEVVHEPQGFGHPFVRAQNCHKGGVDLLVTTETIVH